jgi:hypothetical protein
MWKKTAAVAVLALALAASPAARAEEPSVGQRVDEAMQRALNLMERFIGAIPGYEAPEITPEGDIIIRKKRPNSGPDAADDKPLPEGQRRV